MWHLSYISTRLLSRNEVRQGCHRPLKLVATGRSPRAPPPYGSLASPRLRARSPPAREGPGPRETPSCRSPAGDPAPSAACAPWALATLSTDPAPRALPAPGPHWGWRARTLTPDPGSPHTVPAPGPCRAAYRGGWRSSTGLHAARRPTGRGGPEPRGGAAGRASGRARSARHAGKRSSACRQPVLAALPRTTLPRGMRASARGLHFPEGRARESPAPPQRFQS